MGCCSAPNCSNSSSSKNPAKKRRCFRFPTEDKRRKQWLQNCRRGKWKPGVHAILCEDHFEASQFECNRVDGWKKLKPNAIPTIFNIPNPPKLFPPQRIKGIGMPKAKKPKLDSAYSETELEIEAANSISNSFEKLQDPDYDALKRCIKELEEESRQSKEALQKLENSVKKFLSPGQVVNLLKDEGSRQNWKDEDIVKGLKLRFSLSKHGYTYLLKTGYPAPSYSTLNKRIKEVKVPCGILWDFIELMKIKGQYMDPLSKDCILSVDEMVISPEKDYDPSSKVFVGNSTLGAAKEGTHNLL